MPRTNLPETYADDGLMLDELIEMYRRDRRLDADTRTQRTYEGSWFAYVEHFARTVGSRPRVLDLTIDSVNDFLLNGSVRVAAFSASSKASHGSNIRSVVAKCRKLRLVPADTLAGFEPPAVPEYDPVWFSDDQVAAIFDDMERVRTSSNLRLRAMANIALDNGARPSEIVTLRVGDVFCDPREVRIMGKGRRERFVPLGASSLEYLDDYLRVRPKPSSPSEPLFVDLRDPRKGIGSTVPAKDIAAVLQSIGIVDREAAAGTEFDFYTLRKTFARRAAEAGMDVAELAAIMGHKPSSIPMLLRHYYSPTREHKLRAHAEARPADALHEWRARPTRQLGRPVTSLFDRVVGRPESRNRRPIGSSPRISPLAPSRAMGA